MPTFTMLLAYSVRVYGTTEIEADTVADAIEIVRAAAENSADPDDQVIWEAVHDVDWSTASEFSVVSCDTEDGTEIDGIELNRHDKPWDLKSAETLRFEIECATY